MRKRTLAFMLATALMLFLLACSSWNEEKESATVETPDQDVESELPQDEPSEEISSAPEYIFDAGELAYLNLSRNELLDVYNTLHDLICATDTSLYSTEEQREFEDQCVEQVAAEYNLTADDVNNIFLYGSMQNFFATFDVNGVELTYGETQSVIVSGSEIIIKAKIKSQINNKMTVDQNYYSVCDFIRNYAGTDYTSISYWAVADMSDGSEQKVVSFDLSNGIINTIATTRFPDNTLGNYADNLYIHPSLK